jgi:putative hydrolase of the HAD superfamily
VSAGRERFDVLLFDLGGVVIELDGLPIWMELTREPNESVVWERWLRSPAVRRFESGLASAAEFGDEVVTEFGLEIPAEDFLARFAGWPRGPFPGVLDLIASLRGSFRVACLSNCNELHWPRFLDEMGLAAAFDHHFSSHQLGAMKPDRKIFELAVGELGVAADRVLFLDDNQLNVDGARAAGLHAELAKGPEGIRSTLARLGVV